MDHFWGLLFIIVDLEPNDIQEMYAQMDADGSGTLDFDEFLLGTVGLTGLTFVWFIWSDWLSHCLYV